MQNIPQPLDLLILGNEPAGLWLLREYEKVFALSLSSSNEEKRPARLGWLKIDEPVKPLFINRPTAQHFNLTSDSFFSPQIASPRTLINWTTQNLVKMFPELSELVSSATHRLLIPLSSKEKRTIQMALVKNPKLLTFAQTLWKQLGRCPIMNPEKIIWAALQSTELCYWDPNSLFPLTSPIQTWNLSTSQGSFSVEELPSPNPKDKRKIFKCSLSSGETVLTRNLVINLNLEQLFQFAEESLIKLLGVEPAIFSNLSLYPLSLEFDRFRLPRNISPLTFFLDEEILPDPDHEIWPMTLEANEPRQKITLWVSDRTQFSLEAISDRFKEALRRFHYHFPEALENLNSQSTALGLESCYGSEQRQLTIEALEKSSTELYRLSLLHVRTRKKGLYSLLSALRCDLPYPLGPLTGAQELLGELFDKKTLKNIPLGNPDLPVTSP